MPSRVWRVLVNEGPVEIRALCALTVLSCAVAMCTGLANKPFWGDESIAVLPAKSILTEGLPRNPFDLNYMAPQLEDGLWDPSAPLYRYSVAAVAAVFGFSELSTRGWSVFLALVMMIPLYLLVRRTQGATVALLSVALLISTVDFMDDSREARHFTFVACAMLATFYFLFRAVSDEPGKSRALWPVFATAMILGHAVGYTLLPVVGVFVVLHWRYRGRLLDRRYLWVYGILAVLYGAVQAKYGNTLPLFHSIGCHNRDTGCYPEPTYYLRALHTFLSSRHGGFVDHLPLTAADAPSFAPVLVLVAGMALLAHRAWREPERRPTDLFFIAWLVVPVAILSTRELKFPRYLFYVMPAMALMLAVAVARLGEWKRLGPLGRPLRFFLASLLILMPMPHSERGSPPSGLQVRLVAYLVERLTDEPTDNFEHILEQADYLRRNMGPGDVAVSSYDDASLGYYLGKFVYGFLNSEHDDAFFTGLLDEAEKNGTKVWFLEIVAALGSCHTPGLDPHNIDCREKYRNFYMACRRTSVLYRPECIPKVYH